MPEDSVPNIFTDELVLSSLSSTSQSWAYTEGARERNGGARSRQGAGEGHSREVGKPTLVRITEVRQQVACREGVAAREASKLVVVRRQGETARVQSRQAYACGKHERATAGHGRAQGRGDSTRSGQARSRSHAGK
jgi:hypothetical protein